MPNKIRKKIVYCVSEDRHTMILNLNGLFESGLYLYVRAIHISVSVLIKIIMDKRLIIPNSKIIYKFIFFFEHIYLQFFLLLLQNFFISSFCFSQFQGIFISDTISEFYSSIQFLFLILFLVENHTKFICLDWSWN